MAIARRSAFDQIVARDGGDVFLKAQLSSLKDRVSKFRHCRHPSLVRILDVVDANGSIYATTPAIPGSTWHDAIRCKEITIERIVAISHQLIDAIVCAHEKTTSLLEIHDRSVFVTDQDQIVIAALGANWLAIETDPSCQSAPNAANFMAPPEVEVANTSSTPDQRTDIYLAASLIKQAINASIARNKLTKSDFPSRLGHAVELALAPDPKNRPSAAAAWRREARDLNPVATRTTVRVTCLTAAALAIGIVLYTMAASTFLHNWRMEKDWAELPNTVAALSRYVQQFQASAHASEARRRIQALEREAESSLAIASAKGYDALSQFLKVSRFRGSSTQTQAIQRLAEITKRDMRISEDTRGLPYYDLRRVKEFIREHRANPYGLRNPDGSAAQGQVPEEPNKLQPTRNPEIDAAFEALIGNEDGELQLFLNRYGEHPYAAHEGYTAQLRSWREQLRWAAEEQKLRDEQSKVEWSYD